jgi:signal transduction histidine kinase
MPQRPDVLQRLRQPGPSSTAAYRDRRPVKVARSASDDRFFSHIVSSMRNGVIAFRRDGTLALMNDEAYRIFGLTRAPRDVGRPFSDVLRERPEIIRVLSGTFELSHLPNRAELRLKDLDRVIGYTLSQVKDDDGTSIGAVLFFKDLTRVEQLEERERLRDRLASLGEMAAGIAHELKNPLAGIEVMAGLLRRKIPDIPDAQAVLTDIIEEAKMANAIVQEVLEFVRPIRLQVEHTGIAESLQAAVQLADTKAARGSIAVEVNVPGDLPQIQADHHQLTQLFTNLLINAYEAMDGKGRVAITASTMQQDDGGEGREAVRIELQDNGPGMSPDIAEHVFDPFFTTKAQGSGLGLAIVRKIVDAHDGQIDLRSAAGGGTLIRVTLPVSATPGN